MGSDTRSQAVPSERPAWRVLLFVFLGVAGSVSVTGSILMLVLLLIGGAETAMSAPGPVVAQQTATSSTDETSELQHKESPAAESPPPGSSDGAPEAEPASEEAAVEPPLTTGGDRVTRHQAEAAETTPELPAVAVEAVMKAKAKRLDVGEFATIELPGEAKGFALDPAGGRLAVVGPWEDQVGFLSADDLATGSKSTKPETVSISGTPATVAYVPRESGGVFAVGAREPDGVTFLDAQTLKRLKTVPVKLTHPGFLAASQDAARPHLYLRFVKQTERGRPEMGLARIDVERLEMDARWEGRKYRHVSVSPDGKFIYTLPYSSDNSLTRSRPGVPERDGGVGRWDTVTSRIGQVSTRYCMDPRGAFVAGGSNLYSADVTQLLVELEYDPLAIMGKQPWMAGLRQYDLVIGSTNDGRAVTEITLPEEFLIPNEKHRKPPPIRKPSTTIHPAAFAQVFADEQRGRFVVATRGHVVSLPLDKLDLPDEPHLSLSQMPSNRAIVGNAYEGPLETLSGSPDGELIESPDGMTIENGVVRWSPGDDDVGFVNVRVELKDGRVTHDEAWQIEVGPAKLDVPFLAMGCAASNDGGRAVVWGNDWPGGGKRLNASYERHPGPRLALVDVATRQVVAERKLDFHVTHAEFSKYAIYVSALPPRYSNESTQLLVKFSLDDLRELGEKELASGSIKTIADRYLICLGARGERTRYTLPDMKPVETPSAMRREPPLPRRLADGWLLDGVVWDDNLDKARLLVEPYGFSFAYQVGRDSTDLDRAFQGVAFDAPDRAAPPVDRDALHAGMYTPHIPALLTMKQTMPDPKKQRGPSSGRVHLDLVDLKSNDIVRSVTLRNGFWRRGVFPYDGANTTGIATTPDHVLVTHQGEVLVIPAVDGDGPIQAPFRIAPQQSTFTVSATGSAKVRYEADGATKFDLTIQAVGNTPEEKLESADGSFEIDLRESVPGIVEKVSLQFQRARSYDGEGKTRAEDYVDKIRENYRKLVGKDPSGVPVLVRAEVQAYNRKEEVARLTHAYLVDIPMEEFVQPRSAPPAAQVAPGPPRPAPPARSKETPPPRERPAVAASERRTAVQYSQACRHRMASGKEDRSVEELKADVEATEREFARKHQQAEGKPEPRTWTDTTGRTLNATFIEAEDDVVVVRDDGNRTFRIPLERLSESDRQWVREQIDARVSPQTRATARRLQTLGEALEEDCRQHGSYPPAALVDDDGKPLLSWRVLLLGQLGYQSLAEAFRYDEAWDSEHNRRLIPLMPAVFRGATGVESADRTPYVAIAAQDGMISDRYSTRFDDVKDAQRETLLLVESSATSSCIWTQPEDLSLDSLGRLNEVLQVRDGRVIVCFTDASVGTLAVDTPELEWKKLVSIRDGLKIEAEVEPIRHLSSP